MLVVPHTNVSVLSPGAARGGPGVPQVIHQSPVQVSFEESENHAVQSHPAGRLRLHPGCRGERAQLVVDGYKRELCQQEQLQVDRDRDDSEVLKLEKFQPESLRKELLTFVSLSTEC